MQIILFFALLFAFTGLLFRYRNSTAIYYLAAASWIAAYFWNRMILQSCTGDCNIRVDLVVIAPVVLIATGFALVKLLRRR